MSRVLQTGEARITNSYANHKGWSRGTDVVKAPCLIDNIVSHTAGVVIKIMTGQKNMSTDPEGFGYGNYVIVSHSNGYATLYAHLSSISVSLGQTVSKGQVIGKMGNTGNSYGAHLHFELRKYSVDPRNLPNNKLHDTSQFTWINPEPYLDKDLPNQKAEVMYYVQLGAYSNLKYLLSFVDKCKSSGIDVIVKKYGTIYRVQAGAFSNKTYAEKYRKTVIDLGYKDAYVTTNNGEEVSIDSLRKQMK